MQVSLFFSVLFCGAECARATGIKTCMGGFDLCSFVRPYVHKIHACTISSLFLILQVHQIVVRFQCFIYFGE